MAPHPSDISSTAKDRDRDMVGLRKEIQVALTLLAFQTSACLSNQPLQSLRFKAYVLKREREL